MLMELGANSSVVEVIPTTWYYTVYIQLLGLLVRQRIFMYKMFLYYYCITGILMYESLYAYCCSYEYFFFFLYVTYGRWAPTFSQLVTSKPSDG